MIEVYGTEEFAQWFGELGDEHRRAVMRVVVPRAEKLWENYLAELEAGKHGKEV